MALSAYDEITAKMVIDYYTAKGFNPIAIASLLANWYAEAGLRSNNLQNGYETKYNTSDEDYTARVDAGTWVTPTNPPKTFAFDSAGYGIVQWTSSGRKEGLYNYIKSKNVSISDRMSQVEYSFIEMSTKFPKTYKGLLNATSLRDATILVMTDYERPAKKDDPEAQNKRVSYAEEFYKIYFGNSYQGGKIMSYIMTVNTFLEKLRNVLNYKTLYVHGCFGAPMNAKYKERYKNNTSYNRQPERQAMIDAAESDRFGFDCIGLIKAIAGNWCASLTLNYGGTQVNKETNGISYGPAHMPDYSADGLFNAKYLIDISKDFSKIKPGAVLHMDGHVGVYLGDGKVIECSPKWANGVQITNLGNIGNVAGNYRIWSNYGYLPFIDYTEEQKPVEQSPDNSSVLKNKISEVKSEINKLVSDLNELETLL